MVTQHCSFADFCYFLLIENFCAGISEICSPRDLLLDVACCIWRTRAFVISIKEERITLLNWPSGSGRVPISNLKYFSNHTILLSSKF